MTGGGSLVVESHASNLGEENQRFTLQVFLVAVFSAIGGFLFGYDTGIVSGAMVFIREDFSLNHTWQELIISITILGAWIFSLIAANLASAYGRKRVVYAASIIFAIGSIIMCSAWERWSLLIGRFVVGAGVGLSSMVIPMFIAEMAPSRIRGSLVTTNNLFIAGGQAFAAILAGAFGMIPGSAGWRLMLGVAAIPSAIQFIGFLFIPESPRWLVSKARDEDARDSLKRIRGPDADIDKELEGIKRLHDADATGNQSEGFFRILNKVLKDGHLRQALLMGCLLQMVQQLTGINTVMYYAATIIQSSGVNDKKTAVWLAAAIAGVFFIVNFLGIYLVEKIGRRQLTLYSLAGVIVSLAILAIGFQVVDNSSPAIARLDNFSSDSTANWTDVSPANWTTSSAVSNLTIAAADNCSVIQSTCAACNANEKCGFCFNRHNVTRDNYCLSLPPDESKSHEPSETSTNAACDGDGTMVWAPSWCPSPHSWLVLFGLCAYVLTFGPGMGPMPWTINSELYPLWCRSVCYSIATAVNWFFNLLISLTFLTLTRVITKPGVFWLYAGLGFVGFFILLFFLPETKGRSLEADIGVLLDEQEELSRQRVSSFTQGIRARSPFGYHHRDDNNNTL